MASATATQRLSSISFSGAGFLGCYHMGAAAVLLKHGYLVGPGEFPPNDSSSSSPASLSAADVPPPILTGVSAGSLVSIAVSAGVEPDTGMNVILEVAKRTRKLGGALDILRPGFSLVDQLHDLLLLNVRRALGGTGETATDYDRNLFLRRIEGGRLLRIGLTDKREFSPNGVVKDIPEAYRFVDRYRDVEDAVAASILSSYIPGITGTLKGAACPFNDAVKKSWERIFEMEQLGFIKDGKTGLPVSAGNGKQVGEGDHMPLPELHYWDGGLADIFPTIDDETIIVSPINGVYKNLSISPSLPGRFEEELATKSQGPLTGEHKSANEDEGGLKVKFPASIIPQTVQAHTRAQLGVNVENAESLFRMMWSSDDAVLEERFRNGYDDANKFLSERSMLRLFSR